MWRQILTQVHKDFYNSGFTWISDFERLGKIEAWQVLQPPYRGDCDDAAMTVMEHCLVKGVPEQNLYILRVATEMCSPNRRFDHAILALLDEGNWYVSDNRYPQYPAMKITDYRGHRIYDAVSISNIRGEGNPKLFETALEDFIEGM